MTLFNTTDSHVASPVYQNNDSLREQPCESEETLLHYYAATRLIRKVFTMDVNGGGVTVYKSHSAVRTSVMTSRFGTFCRYFCLRSKILPCMCTRNATC